MKQNSPGLNRSLSLNFCWLRSANHMKFKEECVMCMKKHVSIKTLFTNELKIALQLVWAWTERQSIELKHWLSVKEKVLGTVIWDKKRSININFLENGVSVNSASCCQLFRQNSPYLLNDPFIYIYIYIYIYLYINKKSTYIFMGGLSNTSTKIWIKGL